MNSHQTHLLSGSVIQMFVGAGLAAGGMAVVVDASFAGTGARGDKGNPAAVAKPGDGLVRIAACGAKKGCNPCAAKGCNPCAAKKGCNPCAAKKGCNPCAAKGCNPCAAKSCNPCNPCGGAAKASSAKCQVPRLVTAALANPCAAKKSCNPCAAKSCNPCAAKSCNPCAAKKGCNPCAAKSCNPCGPCSAAAAPTLSTAEARSAYDCLKREMVAGYAKSGLKVASFYKDWRNFSTQPYVSDTHGGRFVNNYANATGKRYGKYEDSGPMPVGSILAKDSFAVHADGKM